MNQNVKIKFINKFTLIALKRKNISNNMCCNVKNIKYYNLQINIEFK